MKRLFCLLLALLWALPARADLARFNQAPSKTRIYEGTTDRSVTLLYGDYRYAPGAIGMIYANRSPTAEMELPLLVVYFVHNGNAANKILTVTTDKKIYRVTAPSSLAKTGVADHPNAIAVAVGPASIEMFQDMAVSEAVTITCGPAKNQFEILLTPEKKQLVKLIVAEYTQHIAGIYETLDRVDRIKYAERPAAQIQVTDAKKAAPSYPNLNSRSKGAAVKKLQRYLIHYGYLSGVADGKYSKKVTQAVKKYQKKMKLKQTGNADANTLKKLYAKPLPFVPAVTLTGSAIQTNKQQRSVFFHLNNTDCEYTIASVRLAMRVLDGKGKALSANGQSTFALQLNQLQLKPGAKRNHAKDSVPLTAFPEGQTVQAGVVSYTLSDGKTINVPTEKIQWINIR